MISPKIYSNLQPDSHAWHLCLLPTCLGGIPAAARPSLRPARSPAQPNPGGFARSLKPRLRLRPFQPRQQQAPQAAAGHRRPRCCHAWRRAALAPYTLTLNPETRRRCPALPPPSPPTAPHSAQPPTPSARPAAAGVLLHLVQTSSAAPRPLRPMRRRPARPRWPQPGKIPQLEGLRSTLRKQRLVRVPRCCCPGASWALTASRHTDHSRLQQGPRERAAARVPATLRRAAGAPLRRHLRRPDCARARWRAPRLHPRAAPHAAGRCPWRATSQGRRAARAASPANRNPAAATRRAASARRRPRSTSRPASPRPATSRC